ncbi:hypothetical protein [Demequina activiva]|uniref:hypothetical protein n=1 Tax=Demequina activiva TaxID=1582364 RepID=UPI0019413E8B|nr:hypothetical protein [Demequina activiva]
MDPLDEPAQRYESDDGLNWLEFTGEDSLEFRLDIPTEEQRSDVTTRCDEDGEDLLETVGRFEMLEPYVMYVFHDVDEFGSPIFIFLEGTDDWGRLWVRPCGLDQQGVALLPVAGQA